MKIYIIMNRWKLKMREVWGIRVQSGPSPGIVREWGGLIIDDKSVCSEIFQCESLFYGGDYVTTLRVQSIYAGGVQSVCLYLRNISNIAYHLSCTVYCDRRLFIPLNNYLLLYQLQMKYYDIVYVYYTIHYTLNVQRTLEAHVQTDFISRLRFFLYKIDPFFFLTTEK